MQKINNWYSTFKACCTVSPTRKFGFHIHKCYIQWFFTAFNNLILTYMIIKRKENLQLQAIILTNLLNRGLVQHDDVNSPSTLGAAAIIQNISIYSHLYRVLAG